MNKVVIETTSNQIYYPAPHQTQWEDYFVRVGGNKFAVDLITKSCEEKEAKEDERDPDPVGVPLPDADQENSNWVTYIIDEPALTPEVLIEVTNKIIKEVFKDEAEYDYEFKDAPTDKEAADEYKGYKEAMDLLEVTAELNGLKIAK